MSELVKLSAYLGERDRVAGRFATEAIVEAFARAALPVGVVLRGIEGFGIRHHLRDDHHLTLSEDLPLVAVGVGERSQVDALTEVVRGLGLDGLITLERAWRAPAAPPAAAAIKLTLYVGRHARRDGEPLHRALVDVLRRHGFDAAIVLLGVDGVLDGGRRRAQMLSANAGVPLMVLAIGPAGALSPVHDAIRELAPEVLVTVEGVQVCLVGHGTRAAPTSPPPGTSGEVWQQLALFSRGAAAGEALVRDLRRGGARGATMLRGVWGFVAGEAPRGDRLWQLRRTAPVMTIVADAPDRIGDHFARASHHGAGGVVTSEYLPAFRAAGPGVALERLALTDLQG